MALALQTTCRDTNASAKLAQRPTQKLKKTRAAFPGIVKQAVKVQHVFDSQLVWFWFNQYVFNIYLKLILYCGLGIIKPYELEAALKGHLV